MVSILFLVRRKSLNPAWNSEWFRFESADDRELQDEPLQIRHEIPLCCAIPAVSQSV